LLSAARVGFTYDGSPTAALRDCTFRIAADDRILLVGESGAGKSTLASLIGGLKRPTEGLLSIGGLDMTSIGWRTWRQHVMIAPQFSQNHLLCGTLAFNLLLGRRWPPQAQDVEEARLVCRELGLGDLLRRMPLGLDQPVGETGWQLSHGEKSRVFLARALLAKADLLIVDESLGALDPATTDMAFRCVLNRSRALLVIAHA
jgi:ATP-binding cassette subfamily B protein